MLLLGWEQKYILNNEIIERFHENYNYKVGIASRIGFSDWLIFVSAIIFNLTISGLYITVKFNNNFFTKFSGFIVVLLTIPFTITIIGFIIAR